MEGAWRARRAEATDEATSLSPPPHSKVGAGVSLPQIKEIVPDVTHACGPQAPRTPPTSRTPRMPRPPRRRDKRAPLGEGATSTELRSSATQATRARALLGPGPTTLGTVYGPDPGAPVGVLK